MYRQSARVYDALCRHKNYAAASATLLGILHRVSPGASSLLDVACGTGQHLQYLGRHYRSEGLDLSSDMLDIARERCPGVPFHEGNLVDFSLPARFDVVTCLFGSIGYCVTPDRLQAAVRSMAHRLQPRGVLVVEPWITPDHFISGRLVFDRVDEPGLAVARMYVTRREGRVSIFESDYLVGTPEGVSTFDERQELGLFTDEEYREAFHSATLDVVETGGDLFGYGLYVLRGRAAADAPNG